MSEKQNKMPAWKDGLLQWERSGGSAERGEDLLWDKLHNRLKPGRTRRRAYFFRAAAILLFLLALGVLLLQKRKATDPAPVVKKEIALPLPVQTAISTTTPGADKKIIHTHKEPSIVKKKDVVIPPEQEIVIPGPDTIPVLVQQQEAPSIQPVAVAVPQKKKLRIVHMNELYAPPPPSYATLKEDWKLHPGPLTTEEVSTTVSSGPSIWPGKNKYKPVSLGN